MSNNCPWCEKLEKKFDQAIMIAERSIISMGLIINDSTSLTREEKDKFFAEWRSLKPNN